jgi:hypothetical protein
MFKEGHNRYEFYKFIEELSDNFAGRANDLISKLTELMKMIFNRKTLYQHNLREEGFARFKEKQADSAKRWKPEPTASC